MVGSHSKFTVLYYLQMSMNQPKSNDPLHGVKLETIVTELVDSLGWEEMARWVKIRCFSVNPSIKSSLTFLRKTPWARTKVEDLYIGLLREREDAASS